MKRRSPFRLFFRVLVFALLAVAIWLGWGLLTSPVSHTDFQQTVVVKPGWSTRRIAAELESAGVIRSANAFVVWRYLHPTSRLKFGEYYFEGFPTGLEAYRKLIHGEVVVHTVVIPEGFTVWDVAEAMEAAKLGPAADFLQLMQSKSLAHDLLGDIDPHATTLEGYLFPDTYAFTRSQSPHEMVAAMVTRFRKEAKAIGLLDVRDDGKCLCSPRQVVTMAIRFPRCQGPRQAVQTSAREF